MSLVGFGRILKNPTNTYYDCAYLMVRSTTGSPNNFPPPGEGWSYIPFDTGNSSGISTSNSILTTNASGVPIWTDTIDCGTF